MTAVDHAELKRTERLKAMAAFWDSPDPSPCEPEGYEPSLGDRGLFSQDLQALLSEIEGLKASASVIEPELGDLEASNKDLSRLLSEAERELAVLRTQAPDSWRPDRGEIVAAIKYHTSICVGDYGLSATLEDVEDAADAILALRPQTAESGK